LAPDHPGAVFPLFAGLATGLLAIEGCFLHQPAFGGHENGHTPPVARFHLCACGRARAGDGRNAPGAGFGLQNGGIGRFRSKDELRLIRSLRVIPSQKAYAAKTDCTN